MKILLRFVVACILIFGAIVFWTGNQRRQESKSSMTSPESQRARFQNGSLLIPNRKILEQETTPLSLGDHVVVLQVTINSGNEQSCFWAEGKLKEKGSSFVRIEVRDRLSKSALETLQSRNGLEPSFRVKNYLKLKNEMEIKGPIVSPCEFFASAPILAIQSNLKMRTGERKSFSFKRVSDIRISYGGDSVQIERDESNQKWILMAKKMGSFKLFLDIEPGGLPTPLKVEVMGRQGYVQAKRTKKDGQKAKGIVHPLFFSGWSD